MKVCVVLAIISITLQILFNLNKVIRFFKIAFSFVKQLVMYTWHEALIPAWKVISSLADNDKVNGALFYLLSGLMFILCLLAYFLSILKYEHIGMAFLPVIPIACAMVYFFVFGQYQWNRQ